MDISNLSATAYTDLIKNQASSGGRLNDSLKTSDYQNATDRELMDVCKQFEAYFLEQMFKSMEKTVLKDESNTTTFTNSMTEFFGDEARQKIASDATETGGLGLAQSLYEQMKRNYAL
ncbi:MAG: rod-binding protein [Lachnospiraceae bacterium]|nr:rod-binding protein [Lachnospiraceae bacterium]